MKSKKTLLDYGMWDGKQMTIPKIRNPRKKYKVGFLTADLVFMMNRQASGLFRIYNGWGTNVQLLKDLADKGCREMRMMVKDGKELKYILTVTPQHWLSKGIPYVNKKLGNEEQLILPEQNFDRRILAAVEVVA